MTVIKKHTDKSYDAQLEELRELLRTAGVADVGELVQRRDQPHPNTYLGPGKIDELRADLARADANLIAVDDELSPRQERNLESALGTPVIDLASATLYAVALTLENGISIYRLHALDLATGNEKFNGPVVIAAAVTVAPR